MNQSTDQRRAQAYTDALFRWRWPVLLLVLAVGVLAASGARKIEFKNDYRYFFREDNPQLTAFEALQNIYTKSDNILFVVAPKSGNVFEKDTVEALAKLTDGGWQLPFATRVDSITNFQHTRAELDDLIVEDLVDATGELSESVLKEKLTVALAEPLLVRRLVSDKAHVTAVNVRHVLPQKDSTEATQAALAARQLADEVRQAHPGVDIYLTGGVMLSNAFFEASMGDLSKLIPLMYGVLLLAMLVFLRSFWGMVAGLLIIALSASTAMGLAGHLGIPITPPSSAAPTMILTLAIADSVHVLVTFFQSFRKGLSKKEAMAESIRVNASPVFLTSLTTVIGLLAMNMSDVRPFNDLGNIAAMGVAAAYVYSMILLPVLVAILPFRPPKTAAKEKLGIVSQLGERVIANRRPLLWTGGLLILGLAAMITRNVLDDQFVTYFDQSIDFRNDTDFTSQELTGIYTLEYSLGAGETGAIADPTYLQNLEDFANWYRGQDDIVHVYTLSDVMKRLNKNMHNDDPSWYKIPDNRELAAQYLLLYEMSLPYGLDLNDQIDVDKSSTRMIVTAQNTSASRMRELQRMGEQWLKDNAPKTMWSTPASTSLMFSHISKRNIRSSLIALTIAIALISIVLAFAFRSVRYGLLSLIPNLVPAVVAFGIWGLVSGRINVALATSATLSLGIIVDDSVHFLSKYLRAKREHGLDTEEAVRYAFSTVGAALVITSAILVGGFLILSTSPFALNAGTGMFVAITLVVALVADLVFLPPLLMALDKEGYKDSKETA